jgi:hypothetical protein
MTRKKSSRASDLNEIIEQDLERSGFSFHSTHDFGQGTVGKVLRREFSLGEIRFGYCAYLGGGSRSLTLNSRLGLVTSFTKKLFDKLENGHPESLRFSLADVAWSIASSFPKFDPSPFHPGNEFALPEINIDEEIALIRTRLPNWISLLEGHAGPLLLDVYSSEKSILYESRWREQIAVFKLLNGESYVGEQLMIDLRDEAAGRRVRMGNYELSLKLPYLAPKLNEKELEFQSNLLANARAMIKNGAFSRLRDEIESSSPNG